MQTNPQTKNISNEQSQPLCLSIEPISRVLFLCLEGSNSTLGSHNEMSNHVNERKTMRKRKKQKGKTTIGLGQMNLR